MASKRQQILEVLLERLKQISVEYGYATNAGERVYLGETPAVSGDDPVNAILMVIQDAEPRQQGRKIYESLPVEIQALAKAEDLSRAYESAEELLGDIIKAVEQLDGTLGGLVPDWLEVGPTRTLPREPGMTTVGVGITYRAAYERGWGQP